VKPTMGLLSGERIVPITHSHDTAGPMTRTVEDAAILLNVLANKSQVCQGKQACDVPNYPSLLANDAWRGKRIGVLRYAPGTLRETEPLYEQTLRVLRDAGATLIETELPAGNPLNAADLKVMLGEFKNDLNVYLATTPPAVKTRTLEQLIAFNQFSAIELRLFGQELFVKAQATAGIGDAEYREALATSKRLAGTEGLEKILNKDRLDALVATTTGTAWRLDLVSGDHFRADVTSYPAVAGYPHVTVPMGYFHELPIGLSVIGPPWSEPLLLSLAQSFEAKTKARKPPKYVPSIDAGLERGISR